MDPETWNRLPEALSRGFGVHDGPGRPQVRVKHKCGSLVE